jgi:hypothetical protein
MSIWVDEGDFDPPDVVEVEVEVVAVVDGDADPPDEQPAAMTATPSIRAPDHERNAIRAFPI